GTTVLPATYTVTNDYDNDNRLTTITYPDGSVVTRAYTARNELDTVKLNSSLVAKRGYDAGGRLTATAYGNGLAESRTYIPLSPLVASITIPGVTSFGYTYDANRRKLTETDSVTPGASQSFSYDDADRLIDWAKPAGGSLPLEDQGWTLTK